MSIITAIILLAGGLLILWKSAELLVPGAVNLAVRLGVSTFVIGLTIVAMGTSTPEVAASIAAVLKANGGNIALGNVYGSNIANLALVGGLSALIRPVTIQPRILKRQIPVMVLMALMLWPVVYNLFMSRYEGFVLLIVFIVLLTLTIKTARTDISFGLTSRELTETKGINEEKNNNFSTIRSILYIIFGLIGLAIGAKMTVEGAVFIGRKTGLSEAVIGLTIIAVGTSLPELLTCLVAAIKGHDDISIGNLVGSNIFNTLLVTGAAGTVQPFSIVDRLAGADYWIMVTLSAVFFVMAIIGRRISRIDGGLLFCIYIGYIVYLLMG
jgi:cation:H+ antiporter